MVLSKKSKPFIILISILIVGNVLLLALSLCLFPSHGGFSRQILFIKPYNNSSGYFIIIDELAPESQKSDIDWLIHSRGKLTHALDQQSLTFTVPSYISNDNVSLNVAFLDSITTLTRESGHFLPVHYKDPYPYDDLFTSASRASYSGSTNPIMGVVLYPKNDSDLTQSFPTIVKDATGLRKIGANDLLYYRADRAQVDLSNNGILFNGQLFFVRKNDLIPSKLDYIYLQNAISLQYQGINYFTSTTPLINILASYMNNSQISGCLKSTSALNTLSLYCPFTAKVVKLDGINTTFTQIGTSISFSISGNSTSFAISSSNNHVNSEYDYLRDSASVKVKPKKDIFGFNNALISNLQHPYILFNQTELENMRIKFNDPSKPWKSWYGNYTSDVNTILANSIDSYDLENRYNQLNKLLLKYVIDGGATYLTKIKEYLMKMGSVSVFTQDLRRSYYSQSFSLAYDMIYNDLTQSERTMFSQMLYDLAEPLVHMDLYPDNNHRVVDAGGLGLAGLALKNLTMIDTAIDTILTYFYSQNPADGGSYEGYSYLAYGFIEMIQFAVSLKFLKGYNLFTDPQILASLKFMAETLGPIGMPSLFEDCTFSTTIQEVLLITAAQLNDNLPLRAQNFQYIWEQRQNNSQLPGALKYAYIKGGSPSFERLTCYNVNESIQSTPFTFRKEIWKETSMAFLRSNDNTQDALFLSFTCKNYSQSHAHSDENSFEIWAYGACIVNNPGYPGWGQKYHDKTIQTNSSNTLLIGGSGQRQDVADGLIESISSPYFSMVIGKANTIYNDLNSPEYASELYFLIIFNFILLGIACLMFKSLSKASKDESITIDKREREEKIDDIISKKKKEPGKLGLIKLAFLHPNQTQDYIFFKDKFKVKATSLNRLIKCFISGLMTMFFLILALDIFSMINYHSTYNVAQYAWFYDNLIWVESIILVFGGLMTFSCSLLALKAYEKLNRSLVYKVLGNQRTDMTRKRIASISSISLIWIFPSLCFSFILLFFTTASSFKLGIHGVFTQFGSLNEISRAITLIFLEFIRNFTFMLTFFIPFLLITLRIFSHGLSRNAEGNISKKTAWKISLTSIIILLVIFFTLFITLYISIDSLFSLVSYEGASQF